MTCTDLAILYIRVYPYEIWGFHGDKNSEHDILGSGNMQSGTRVQMQTVPATIRIFHDTKNFKPQNFTTNHFPILKY
jgi:hypothetical protein